MSAREAPDSARRTEPSASPIQSPPESGPVLSFEPPDLSTSTGQTPIRAFIANNGRPVDSAVLAELVAAVELRRAPEMAVVPVKAEIVRNPEPNAVHKDGPLNGQPLPNAMPAELDRTIVELQPLTPLTDSWHVVSLSRRPSGLQLGGVSSSPPVSGVYSVRFHTGTSPTLSQVLFCPKSDGSVKATFYFSENVSGSVKFDDAIGLRQTGASCSVTESGPDPSRVWWIEQTCKGLDSNAELHVFANSGIKSRGGQPLRAFAGQDMVEAGARLSELPEGEPGCKVWRQ